eukprot:gb/GECH01013100.1/.p1 GENE.gb/GECH01013100.1/~~gb/GECH01013100.1/.p1  ORF type:complete len:516 (+),score=99.12 gb/GECH01013100.1/:1-1548(+)
MEQIILAERIFSFLTFPQTLRLRLLSHHYAFHPTILWQILSHSVKTNRGLLLPHEWNSLNSYPRSIIDSFLKDIFKSTLQNRNNLFPMNNFQPIYSEDDEDNDDGNSDVKHSYREFYKEFNNTSTQFDKKIECVEVGRGNCVKVQAQVEVDSLMKKRIRKYRSTPPIRASLYGSSSSYNSIWTVTLCLKDDQENTLIQEKNFCQKQNCEKLDKEFHVVNDYSIDKLSKIVLQVSGTAHVGMPVIQLMTPIIPFHDIAYKAFQGKELDAFRLPFDALDHMFDYVRLKDILNLRSSHQELFPDMSYRQIFKRRPNLCSTTEFNTVGDWRAFFEFVYQTRQNLIKNPNGEEGLRGWRRYYEEWTVEDHGGRYDDFLNRTGNCFVGSFSYGGLIQEIDLSHNVELWEQFQKYCSQSSIHFSLWCGGRRDCGSFIDISFRIIDQDRELIDEFKIESHSTEQTDCTSEYFDHEFREFTANKCPRYLVVHFAGRDNKTWAGYYGPRVAGVTARVFLPFVSKE